MALKDLRPNEKNPRSIKDGRFAELKRALSEDPEMLQARPVIALPDGTVIAGNMRLRAAEALGWEDIPTVVVELDAQRAQLWALRDNASYGEWVDQDLAEMLFELGQEGADLGLTGLDEKELSNLLDSVGGIPREGANEVPDLPEEPDTQLGDTWIMGDHRLLCGDATNPTTFAELMNGSKASMMWTDPPYGVNYVGKTAEALRLQNDDPEGTSQLLVDTWLAAQDSLSPGSPFYIACPAVQEGTLFRLSLERVGWHLHQSLVWVKDSMVLGHSDYHYRHEDILYGYVAGGEGRPGRGNHNGTRWMGDHSQTSVFEIPRPKRSEDHPTMKPVELVGRCIRNSAPVGATVLDPFLGSGSTLIAAHEAGRRLCGLDIDPRYCDVAVQRWEEFTGQKAERA